MLDIQSTKYKENNYVGTSKIEKVDKGNSKMMFDNNGLVDPSDMEEDHIFYTDNGNVTCVIYIVCLVDSGTTSHVFNNYKTELQSA